MDATDFLPLQTPRVLLRRMGASDAERFAEYRADSELARYQGWSPMSAAEARAFVDEMQHAPAFLEGAWLQIAIAELPHGGIVGDVGFCSRAGGEVEVGFTLRRQSHGQGLATEALQAFTAAVLRQPGVNCIVGVVDARNMSSIRVLERLGMTAVSSEATLFKGEPCTELRYELRGRHANCSHDAAQ